MNCEVRKFSYQRQKMNVTKFQHFFQLLFLFLCNQRASWRRMDGCTHSSLSHANYFFCHSHIFLSGSISAAILPWFVRLSVFNVFLYPTWSWIKNFDLLWLSFFIWNFMCQTDLYFMKQSPLTLACYWPFALGEMTVKISLAWLH